MDIRAFDLNLIKAFDALMAERSVSRAAGAVGISQPAMSQALARLRRLFKDELFVRGRAGLEPTGRALEIAAQLEPAVARIRSALGLATDFDPATTERTFTAGMAEYAEIPLVDRLAESFSRQAPKAVLRLVPVTSADFAERIDGGKVDVALLRIGSHRRRYEQAPVFQDRLVVVARRGHPKLRIPLTLEDYAASQHVLVSPRGARAGGVDKLLAKLGLARRIALYTGTYMTLPLILGRSDYIATVPDRTARRLAAMADLELHPTPFDMILEVTMAWHQRYAGDAGQAWFRSLLSDVARA